MATSTHGIVVAHTTANVVTNGQRVHIGRGEAWPADDPTVLAHPNLFTADMPHRTPGSARVETTVETATRAPGERRKPSNRKQGSKRA